MEQLRVWTPALVSQFDSMGLAAFLRGSEPSHALQYKPRDLSLLPLLPETVGEGPREARIALRATIEHDNAIKADMKLEWTRDQKQRVATIILDSMRSTAVSRFEEMKASHPQRDESGAVIVGAFDGVAMALAIIAEYEAASVDEWDAADHQLAVTAMISTRLPDNCTHTEYGDKATLLRVKHNPYLERPYSGAILSKVYQDLLPVAALVDSRQIRRSMEAADTWKLPDVVFKAFLLLVKQLHDPLVHSAAVVAAAALAAKTKRC